MDIERFDLDSVHTALAGEPIGHTIDYRHSVPSTMPLARGLAEEAADPASVSGALVVADEQTAGRGRLNRRWETPPGRALLVSVVVAGEHLPLRPAQLPMIAGLAVLDAARAAIGAECGGKEPILRLKWPNDLVGVTAAGPVKLAGLLAESVLHGDRIRFALLGIGVNVNQQAQELPSPRAGGLPPASLRTLCGRPFRREALLIALCRGLSGLLAAGPRPDPARIHARWQAELVGLGQAVTVYPSDPEGAPWAGIVRESDLDGNLLVENLAGHIVSVSAGDVSLAVSRGT